MTAIEKRMLNDIRQARPKQVRAKEIGELYRELCNDFPLLPISCESDYKAALETMMALGERIQKQGENQTPKDCFDYLQALGILVEDYEKRLFLHVGKDVRGIDVLTALMEANDLKQEDLKKELGHQSVVSMILSGRRSLTVNQIAALAARFNVSESVFFDTKA